MKHFVALLAVQLFTISNSYGKANFPDSLNWSQQGNNIQFATCNLLRKTNVSDNLITLVRFLPSNFDINLIEYKKTELQKTSEFWVDSFDYNLVVNAGMYDLNDVKKHRFFMQNLGVINNPILNENAKGIIAFNPFDDTIPNFDLFDLSTISFVDISTKYKTIIQGFRLINDAGEPVFWEKNDQFCSMIIIAEDSSGFIYIIFCRSPITHNQMTENLLSLDLGLKNAIYLEGGSKATFSIKEGAFRMNKMGSYVSNYYPFDTNYDMPVFPNYMGFKLNN